MAIFCGEFGRLSVTISEAHRTPDPVGKKLMLIEQLAFTASTVGQVAVILKSAAFVPVN
jgi:hypothetical protein